METKTYRDLVVWQKAMDLVEMVYKLSEKLPDKEKFGLISQIQRAAVSVPANIAEGYGRLHRGDYLRHLSFARGSLAELETHVAIVVRLAYVTRDDVKPVWGMAQEVGKMLRSMIEAMQREELKKSPTLDARK